MAAGSSSSSFTLAALSCLLPLALLAAATASSTAHEKETHLRVFWQDVASGGPTVATIVKVAEGPPSPSSNASSAALPAFGTVFVLDDALTDGPDRSSSKLVGRAQGMYVSAGKDSPSLMMAMNFVFVDGDYNGSSLAILGANPFERPVREMPVVGGTGVFRFARGYCRLRTHWFNSSTGDATVEYNFHVRHD